ncbi:MAG: hypothetical protein EZS28_009930 [Streblomastix strix]|uniref:DDE-1 domain-containing protein n=1 Tax=Streblomastix strix TaxID=222440 RepID=A0A5J4WHR4_9EUKA|nr:MAG: hypothetical protein EZS28_009930 [Streblomastix strix]
MNQLIKDNEVIAEYQAGFVYRLKGRHAFNHIPIYCESGFADCDGALRWIDEALPSILEQFEPEDIFNLDGFNLFFCQAIRYTIKIKCTQIKGTKTSKQRIIGFSGASIAGKKLPFAIIELSMHPRSFNGHKVQPFHSTTEGSGDHSCSQEKIKNFYI